MRSRACRSLLDGVSLGEHDRTALAERCVGPACSPSVGRSGRTGRCHLVAKRSRKRHRELARFRYGLNPIGPLERVLYRHRGASSLQMNARRGVEHWLKRGSVNVGTDRRPRSHRGRPCRRATARLGVPGSLRGRGRHDVRGRRGANGVYLSLATQPELVGRSVAALPYIACSRLPETDNAVELEAAAALRAFGSALLAAARPCRSAEQEVP